MLGVSQRTVQRWVTKKPGARRPPGPLQVKAIEEAVLARWQPRVRARLRAQAEAEGFVFHTRARFGFVAPAGSSDDPRVRWITQPLPGEVARELFAGGPSYGAVTCPGRRTRPARFTGHYGPAAGKASLRHRESGCRSGPGAPGPRPGPRLHCRSGLGGGPQVAVAGAAWPSPQRAAGTHGSVRLGTGRRTRTPGRLAAFRSRDQEGHHRVTTAAVVRWPHRLGELPLPDQWPGPDAPPVDR